LAELEPLLRVASVPYDIVNKVELFSICQDFPEQVICLDKIIIRVNVDLARDHTG
jgi:hypothetical protein